MHPLSDHEFTLYLLYTLSIIILQYIDSRMIISKTKLLLIDNVYNQAFANELNFDLICYKSRCQNNKEKKK